MISYIITVAFFIFLEGLFSGSEIALFSVNKSKLKYQAKEGDKKAEKIYNLLEKYFTEYVGTALIGTTLSIVIATTVFVSFLYDLANFVPFIHSKEEILAESLIIFTLIFGEIIPKSIFQHYAEKLIFFIVPFLEFFRKIFKIFLIFANILTKIIYKIFNVKAPFERIYTREEILDMILSESEDIPNIEKKIISNVIIFKNRRLGEIVIPLIDVIMISDDKKVADAIEIFKETGFSRIPIYRKRVDNIIGVIRAYDVINANPSDNIVKYLKGIRYIPEFTNLPNVLKGFKHYKDHMAVVVDERGVTIGIITINDVLAEIVGQIKDKTTKREQNLIKEQTDKYIVVDGRIEIKEVETILQDRFPSGPYETLGGMIIYHLGRMARRNEVIVINNYKFTILQIEKRRIKEIKIEILDNL